MSVDKFGLMGDDSEVTTNNIIQPIYKHATNLDDLENVQGFNEEGYENRIYGFKLNNKGIYTRQEVINEGINLDNNGVVDRPMVLIWTTNGWTTAPMFHNYTLDFKLNNQTISTKGENHIVLKVYNSGTMISSLIPSKSNDKPIILKPFFLRGESVVELFLTAITKKSTLILKAEFLEDERSFTTNVPGTVIIEGIIFAESSGFKEILNGLNVKTISKNNEERFRIIIKKENSGGYKIENTKNIETEFNTGEYNLSQFYLYPFYGLSRMRYTDNTITKEEISHI